MRIEVRHPLLLESAHVEQRMIAHLLWSISLGVPHIQHDAERVYFVTSKRELARGLASVHQRLERLAKTDPDHAHFRTYSARGPTALNAMRHIVESAARRVLLVPGFRHTPQLREHFEQHKHLLIERIKALQAEHSYPNTIRLAQLEDYTLFINYQEPGPYELRTLAIGFQLYTHTPYVKIQDTRNFNHPPDLEHPFRYLHHHLTFLETAGIAAARCFASTMLADTPKLRALALDASMG